VKNTIPYSRHSISDEDVRAVVEVLGSDWLTQGPVGARFEQIVASYCSANYAVAVNSATSALHIACLAAGLGPGDRLWTSPITFVASANCGRCCGADIDFVDIDPRTYNISVDILEDKLERAQRSGTLPKVIVLVHFAGQSCEMARIAALSKRYGFSVIEDASHALGGRYQETRVGSCVFSDMAIFSFHPVKIITTGEGGMIMTNRKELYDQLVRLRSHGITRNPALMSGEMHGPWYYEQIELGFNYRMNDIQAALGTCQMGRLDEFVERRHLLAERYRNALNGLPITNPWQHPDTYSAWHLYVIRILLNRTNITQVRFHEELRSAGIQVNLHYIPVHTHPYYRKLGFAWGDFPQAEQYYREAVSLPLYFDLSEQLQDYVIDTIHRVLR